jgi:lipid-binding SYLF domain-containing protein
MNVQRLMIAVAAVVLTCSMSLSPALASEEAKKVEEAVSVVKDIMAIPEKGIPPALLSESYAVAIIPGVIKLGFIIGGRHGSGVLLVRDKDGKWGNPLFVSLTGGSIGWQVGAQSTDVLLVFKSRKGVEGIKKGKFTLGADAAVAAGPVGRSMEAATDVRLKAEIYSYSRSRGLFAGISLEGAALQIDDDANAAFYGKEAIRADDILSGKVETASADVVKLQKLLTEYATVK